jgi:hypothetical protein
MQTTDTLIAKLDAFVKLAEAHEHARHERDSSILIKSAQERGRRTYSEWGYDAKATKRFVRIWRDNGQKGVAYFVDRETGVIFGAKGWKAYNPNHEYGTLDTITEYDWSGYYGVRLDGTPTLVPKELRR